MAKNGLAAVLSGEAAELYERLVATGGLPLDEHPELSESVAAKDLVAKGFARERHVGVSVLVPVEPSLAVDNAILVLQRQILDQHQILVRLRDEMQVLQRTYLSRTRAYEGPQELVRVLTDRAEIGALSVELCLSAEHDVASIETEHFTKAPDPRSARVPPAEVVERGVTFRNVYSRAALEIPGAATMVRSSIEAGWNCRVYPNPPMKMVLIDQRSALLPIDPTGMDGAVLIQAPVIVAALRMYFELLWGRATPLDTGTTKLTADQDRVLRLVITGMTDAAIARHLGVSERTVRRHVGALLELLQAENRVALAAIAVREKWVP
jgi:DNA-binding CsgD family transcriptional regulator